MKKISPKILLIVAAVLSILCAILMYVFLDENTSEEIPTKKVVVASVDIEPGKEITESMIKVIAVPDNMVQLDSIEDMNEIIGKRAKVMIYSGDQITQKRLNSTLVIDGFVGSIPDDKRAVTIKVDEVDTISGFLKPGEYVDLICVEDYGDGLTNGKLLFQNILVLAVGKDNLLTETSTNINATHVTLSISPEDAVRLRVAQKKGNISLILRPNNPKNNYVYGADVMSAPKMADRKTDTNVVNTTSSVNNKNVVSERPVSTVQTAVPATVSQPTVQTKPVVETGTRIKVIRGTETN